MTHIIQSMRDCDRIFFPQGILMLFHGEHGSSLKIWTTTCTCHIHLITWDTISLPFSSKLHRFDGKPSATMIDMIRVMLHLFIHNAHLLFEVHALPGIQS